MENSHGASSISDSGSSGLLIDLSDRVSDGCLTRTISCSGSLTATSCSSTEAVEEPGDKASEEPRQPTSPTVDSNDWWWLKPLPNPEDKDYKLLRPIDEEEFDFDIPEEYLNSSLSSSSSESEITDDSFDLEAFIRKKRRPVTPSPLIQAKTAQSQEANKMADATATQPDSLPINAVSSLVVNNDEEVPLDDEGIEKDSLTSETQSCVVSVSVAECPVELDRNSCADDEERKEEEEGRVTPLVQDLPDKQDIECDKEPVVEAWKENEREERKEEDIDNSKESQEGERDSKEVKNITVTITTTDTSASSDSIRSSEDTSSEGRPPQLDSQPQTEEEGEMAGSASTGREEDNLALGDSRCSSSSSEIDSNKTKLLTDSAQSSCSSSTTSSPSKSTTSQASTTTRRGLKRPLRSALAKPSAGKATKTVSSAEGRTITKPSSTKIHILPQTSQATASNFIRTKTFRVKRGTRPDSKQPVLQRPSIPPKMSSDSPPRPARRNTVRSQLSSPAKVSLSSGLAARKPPFNKAARPVANRPFSQQGTKKTVSTLMGEKQNLAQQKTAAMIAITIEDQVPPATEEPLSQTTSSPVKKQSTPIKSSSTSPLPSHTLAQTLDFSLSSIKSECSSSTDKQSHTFTKDTDPPSPPHFPQEVTVIKKPTMVPTKRRSIPRPSCSGLLKSSTTASNIPKSSASGLIKGGAGTRTKGLSKLPRTNTRTGILRAQKLSTKVEKINEVALMAKMNSLPKVVHSPVNKENQPASPHSEWSPIRRQKTTTAEESYIMCTKHTHK